VNDRTFDAVSIITGIVLIPLVALTGWAYLQGSITFADYVGMWNEPVALMLGFWFRGVGKES